MGSDSNEVALSVEVDLAPLAGETIVLRHGIFGEGYSLEPWDGTRGTIRLYRGGRVSIFWPNGDITAISAGEVTGEVEHSPVEVFDRRLREFVWLHNDVEELDALVRLAGDRADVNRVLANFAKFLVADGKKGPEFCRACVKAGKRELYEALVNRARGVAVQAPPSFQPKQKSARPRRKPPNGRGRLVPPARERGATLH